VLKLTYKPALIEPRNHAAELDIVYPRSALSGTGAWHRFRQWFYNYVLPVLAILALPILILPIVATFIFACARMHHDEPDSELYGSKPINGTVTLEDPEEEREPAPASKASKSDASSVYHWN
jgi:hypothetical protein